jgi:hypothetical protein
VISNTCWTAAAVICSNDLHRLSVLLLLLLLLLIEDEA